MPLKIAWEAQRVNSMVERALRERLAVGLFQGLDGGFTCITRLSNGLPYKTFYE
jgi:hypothetical protein